jgi:outer membrane protein OmpA-like peptidoglycan-associated protein
LGRTVDERQARSRWAGAGATALTAVLLLTGCGRGVTPSAPTLSGDGLEIVVGTHANEPAPDLPMGARSRLAGAITGEKFVGIVAVEGTPRVLQPPLPMSVTGETPAARADSNRRNAQLATTLIRNARPATRGADLLTALLVAAKDAHSADVPIPRIVAIDNGLSDRGPLNFTVPGMTSAAPKDVAAAMLRKHVIRADTFEGLTVEFVGLGTAVAAPQPPLGKAEVTTVTSIYSAVVQAGGGTAVITSLKRVGAPVKTSLAVAVVKSGGGKVTLGGTSALGDGSSIAFQPGTATFRDPAAASNLLRPVAAWLRPGGPHRAIVVGTTSSEGSASKASDLLLSRARADAVKRLLVSLGADPTRIDAQGKGYIAQPPDRVNGVLDPAKAAQNRVVRITTIL